MPNILFTNNTIFTTKKSKSKPEQAIKNLPKWYIDGDRFAKMPDGTDYIAPKHMFGGGRMPTWKACPAMYDAFGTGYMLKTPCDIEFFINDAGHIDCKVLDKRFESFVSSRPPMPGFSAPMGYSEYHFAWYGDWAIKTDPGYSTMYLTPMNRFDLPFQNTVGIIDTDSTSLPGTLPFFIANGWTGVLPAGTPFVQIMPFKREDWKSDYKEIPPQQIYTENMNNSAKYRKKDGGVYQRDVWQRRKYE